MLKLVVYINDKFDLFIKMYKRNIASKIIFNVFIIYLKFIGKIDHCPFYHLV